MYGYVTYCRMLTIDLFSVVQSAGAGLDLTCGIRCNFLWDGFGNWVSGKRGTPRWKPFVTADGEWRMVRFRLMMTKDANKPSLIIEGLCHNFVATDDGDTNC